MYTTLLIKSYPSTVLMNNLELSSYTLENNKTGTWQHKNITRFISFMVGCESTLLYSYAVNSLFVI